MDWAAEDQVAEFTWFRQRMEMYLTVSNVPDEKQFHHIVLLMGDEGLRRWNNLTLSDNEKKDPKEVWKAFEASLEKSQTFWSYVDEYLSDFRQGPTETTAELDVRIQTLVRKCQFPAAQHEHRQLELL